MNKIMKYLKIFESLKRNNKSLDKLFGKIESFANQLKCDANYDLCLNSVKMCKTIDEFKESENKKRFKCFWPKCQYSAKLEIDVNKHIVIHSNETQFVCDFNECNKTFKLNSTLIQHKRTHFKTEDNKIFKCFWPKCYFKAHSKGQLNQHFAKHSNERQFVCDYFECNYSTKNKRWLDEHKLGHSIERPFICDFKDCNKTFKYTSNLNRHKRRHNEKKSFKCDFKDCDKSYPFLDSLKSHQKYIHSDIRYRCFNCNKTFPRKNELKEHERIHSGEKPFKCGINGCDKSFRVKKLLNFHQRNKLFH